MKFTKHQKDIIRHIASEDITDIVSYIKYFGLSTLRKLDKDKIEERFKKETAGKTVKKLKDDFSKFTMKNNIDSSWNISSQITFHEPTEADYECVPLKIAYPETEHKKKLTDSSYFSYDYFKGINIVNSFSDIKDFLAIWQYLKNEGLILEVEKEIGREDYELFFEYIPFDKTSFKEANDAFKAIGERPIKLCEYPENVKDYRDFADYLFEYNTTHELICSQFLGKQIYGTSELDVFIKSNFKTKNDKQFLLALIPAYVGVFVALFTPFIPTDNSDVEKIQQQLSEIQEKLEDNNSMTSTELQNISDQLEEISESGINDSKLDELVNEILQKTNPQ